MDERYAYVPVWNAEASLGNRIGFIRKPYSKLTPEEKKYVEGVDSDEERREILKALLVDSMNKKEVS